jgi:tryptophan halogenase
MESGRRVEGDLFVDCSGFRSELLGRALEEPFVDFKQALFCDRAVVGDWRRTDEVILPYTVAETMNAGWCWQIEHEHLINRGYVFSSAFLSDAEATEEYRRVNPKVEKTHVIKFRSGVHRRTWVKNVVALGNAAGFVEPLESTAIGMICDGALHLVRTLMASNGVVHPIQRDVYNRITGRNWEIIRDFLAIHYRFNNRLDTPFWKACQNDVDLGDIKHMVDYYQEVGPDLSVFAHEMKRDIFSAEGYFVMLVGQKVPHRSPLRVEPAERERWQSYKKDLAKRAAGGMDMPEVMKMLREGSMHGAPSDRPGMVDGDAMVEGVDIGELTWH